MPGIMDPRVTSLGLAKGRVPRPAIFAVERDRDPRAARWHVAAAGCLAPLMLGAPRCVVVSESPGEGHLVRLVDLEELPGGLEPVGHPDAVDATGYRFQLGLAAHPLHVAHRVGEIGEEVFGCRRYVHGHFDRDGPGHGVLSTRSWRALYG